MIKRIILNILIAISLMCHGAFGQVPPSAYLIPAPNQEVDNRGVFSLPLSFNVSYAPQLGDSMQSVIQQMADFVKTELNISFVQKAKACNVLFILDKNIQQKEGYRLNIATHKITIAAADAKGAFYGWQTLHQILLYAKMNGQSVLPCTEIYDFPRYGFRALMLDPARNFLSIDELKAFIRTMSFYKYNYLHLHLTDDQGWRIQIKAYPELTEKGSIVKQQDGKDRKLFYTQDQLKDLVQFAAGYFVQIIPEIDIPGHNTALLTAFPELACFPKDFKLRTSPGVSEDILDASNPKVYKIYETILKEVASIFPCKYFHLGGDEAPLVTWEASAACQELIEKKGLKDSRGLMAYFLAKNSEVIQKLGKTPLFWYEMDVPSYPKNSIAYFWRMGLSEKVIKKAASEGYPLIGAPGEHAYFDYPMSRSDTPYSNLMPVTTLKDTYEFNPAYKLPENETKNVIGVEATIWGEYIPSLKMAYFRTYPRALALSEVGWSAMKNRDWKRFKSRLVLNLSFLTNMGVNYEVPFDSYGSYN